MYPFFVDSGVYSHIPIVLDSSPLPFPETVRFLGQILDMGTAHPAAPGEVSTVT